MGKFEDSVAAFRDLLDEMSGEELLSHHDQYRDDISTSLFEFLCDIEPSYYATFDFEFELMEFVDISNIDDESDLDFAANDDHFSVAA